VIAVLAQMAPIVPGSGVRLGVIDRCFTRRAADDLARGRSTFMVEMVETPRSSTRRPCDSMVILDEMAWHRHVRWSVDRLGGNGTSATTQSRQGAVATHFHELTL